MTSAEVSQRVLQARELFSLALVMHLFGWMVFSEGVFMPPVAREVCAFLGELAFIRFAKMKNDAVYREFCNV